MSKHFKYERSGGFAGMTISTEFDLDELPADQAKALQGILDSANFDELPAQILPPRPGADQFNYKITIGSHTVETTDSAAPEKLKPLLAQLQQVARTRPRG